MTNTHALSSARRSASTLPAPAQARRLQASIITAAVAAFSLAFIATFGAIGAFVVGASVLVPLLLLWLSSDVVRSDERAS
ncbi:MAG: hypothetical protein KIT84_16030 [Labilithrix sp.]|nr:hypothetical protein [Labilithrix sp.]MCW5812537.1 hypothetical protein [Labilithrix sp.]